MTIFIIVAALLTLAALFFVIPPLLRAGGSAPGVGRQTVNLAIYRDQLAELERDLANDVISQEQYEQGKVELERRLLEDVPGTEAPQAAPPAAGAGARPSAVVIALVLPALAVGGYLWLGMPAALTPGSAAAVSAASEEAGMQGDMSQQINKMVAQLERRLKDEPDDPEGWAMLGRSYLVLQRFDDARTALQRAMTYKNDDPQVLVDYADALAMTSGQTLEGQPIALIERALQIDPGNQKGLWLAGTAAYERADYKGAMDYWKRLQALVPPGSEAAQAMERNIAEAESLMGGAAPVAAPTSSSAPQAAAGKSVTGTVRIDGALRSRVADDDTVFIFARAPKGPPMPLAVKRARVADLPLAYTLDDSLAMNPALSISGFSDVEVVARVSRSGNATAQSGDLQGSSGIVKVGARSVEVLINDVVR